ncbi:hypothetical protein [uncultured Nostoc sp.]|uniref:hypothetical protein n=1 Tax=uncultured Nostoc sp. TaxID=340711 RepID=UPI0026033020|nr:hypothetical protein [uncultured Nostoc sp.]
MRFEADPTISQLWVKAGNQELHGNELAAFKRIVAHEYVELALMKNGLPYKGTPQNPGAHELAPHADYVKPPFAHWKSQKYPIWEDVDILY